MTLKYINKNIENLKEDLACTNKTIESIENYKGLLEFHDEKLNRAYRLREEIEHLIQDLEAQKEHLAASGDEGLSPGLRQRSRERRRTRRLHRHDVKI